MPGYDTAYKGYAYDVEKAKALLAEAGHADGFETELFAMNTDPIRASPRRSSRISPPSASRPTSRRWRRPTSLPPAATRPARR
jgi:ABC-type transport system substrate-binding protein